MKQKLFILWVAIGVAVGSASMSLLAQNTQRQAGPGFGYGGPPKSQEERAARQAACFQRQGGWCPGGGLSTNCPYLGAGRGQGHGLGRGNGWRHGWRAGNCPRVVTNACPLTPTPPAK